MHQFFSAFVTQLLAPFREKKAIIMFMIFLFSAWIAMETYHKLTVDNLRIALVDYDNSEISRKFISILMNNQDVSIELSRFASVEAARILLETGEKAAILIIPEKFSSKIKTGKTAHIAAYIDGSNILISKNVNKAIVKASVIMGAGIAVNKMRHLSMPNDQALARAMPLKIISSNIFNPALNYGVYLVPGLLFFLLQIYITLLMAGLFQPALFSGNNRQKAGRMAGIFVFSLAIALLFYYLWMPYLTLNVHSSFALTISVTALFIVTTMIFVTSIHMVAFFSPPLAMDASILIAMLSLTLSGITWPTDMFPTWIAWFSYIMPFRPFAQAFQVFIHGSVSFSELSPHLHLLIVQALLYSFIAIVMILVRKKVRHEI